MISPATSGDILFRFSIDVFICNFFSLNVALWKHNKRYFSIYQIPKYYTAEFKERHLVRNGEIIVANTEQGHEFKLIGCPAIVPSFYGEKGLFSQHIYRVILKENSYLTTVFLYYLLMTPNIREQIISATNGSTVNMLAIDGLQRPKFKLPPKEKVVQFSGMVTAWWKKKNLNKFQIRTLEKLRDELLPKLMSGEVRVEV